MRCQDHRVRDEGDQNEREAYQSEFILDLIFFNFSLFRTLSYEHGKVIEFDLETSGDIKG